MSRRNHNPRLNRKPLRDLWREDPSSLKTNTWKEIRHQGPRSAWNSHVTGDVLYYLRKEHLTRSRRAQIADEGQNAPITTEEEDWRDRPNRLDFPGIDTISAERARKRAEAAIQALYERGHIHAYTYEKYSKPGTAGQFFHAGRPGRRKRVPVAEGSSITFLKSQKSGKPEIHIYKANETGIERAHSIAHEGGHAMDWAKSPKYVYDVPEVYSFEYSQGLKATHNEDLTHLSKFMRGDYNVTDRSQRQYRERSTEQLADALSSYIIQPRATRREAPALYPVLHQTANDLLGLGWRNKKLKLPI